MDWIQVSPSQGLPLGCCARESTVFPLGTLDHSQLALVPLQSALRLIMEDSRTISRDAGFLGEASPAPRSPWKARARPGSEPAQSGLGSLCLTLAGASAKCFL